MFIHLPSVHALHDNIFIYTNWAEPYCSTWPPAMEMIVADVSSDLKHMQSKNVLLNVLRDHSDVLCI